MTAASSICRIRLSCSTTGPTSNWKALAIAVLLRLGDFLISRRLYYDWASTDRQRVSGLGSTHGPLGEETERRKRRGAGAALVWNNRETEMGDLAEIEALFFALIGVLPVGEHDKLVGMITDRDIAIRGIAEGKGPDPKAREVMSQE